MKAQLLPIAAGLVLMATSFSFAQAPKDWTSVWKMTNGTCGDGIIINVSEKPSLLVLKSSGTVNIPTSTREVTLAVDGSGKLEYRSDAFGRMQLEVPAGSGKRPLALKQINGPCQWRAD